MNWSLVAAVYSKKTVPDGRRSTPHPKQVRHRHAWREPQNAYDPNADVLLRVSIK